MCMDISTEFIKDFVREFRSVNKAARKYNDFNLGLIVIRSLKHVLIPGNGVLLDTKRNKYDKLRYDMINFYIDNNLDDSE